jgi:membrane dipeptidase
MRKMIDAHLDLAMNLVFYDRDITVPLSEMNAAEEGLSDQKFRTRGTVTLPEMRASRIPVCLATLLARSGPEHRRAPSYRRSDLDFPRVEGAYASCWAQRSYYHWLEQRGEIRQLRTRQDLEQHWQEWEAADDHSALPIGVILSVEGADPIAGPEALSEWFDWGVRAIGLSHYGQGRYAAGTGTPGGLTELGRAMLPEMSRVGIALDVTHLADEAMAQAFEMYEGPIWASHHNCRSLVDWDRQLTDGQIQQLIEKDGVIGLAFDAVMLHPQWERGVSKPESLPIEWAADHVDHICQMAGSARHCGIGTDLDGGYGWEQTPNELKSIRDVHRLEEIFAKRGYADEDIDAIFWGNWFRKLSESLPHAL